MSDVWRMPQDYGVQRERIQDDYARRLAENSFATFLSQQRGSRQLGDLARSFSREYPRFSAGFGRRGLNGPNVRSGVYSRALNQGAADYARARSDVIRDLALQNWKSRLFEDTLADERERMLYELERAKQRDIENAAMNVFNFKTYLGG